MDQIVTSQKTAEKQKKESKKREATPKLRCIITGDERFTNQEYLKNKATKFGSVNKFLARYVCQSALKLLKEGKSVQEIRSALKKGHDLPVPSETILKEAMKMNGKGKAAAPAKAEGAGKKTAKASGTKKPAKKEKPATVPTAGGAATPEQTTEPAKTEEAAAPTQG